jgi:hypothetical protein
MALGSLQTAPSLPMGPKPRHNAAEQDLSRIEPVNLIDQRHELVKLAALIDCPARAAYAVDGLAAAPKAHVRAVGRGRGRALDREPVLAAL